MTAGISAAVEEISTNRAAGATALARRGLDGLESLARDLQDDPAEALARACDLAALFDSLRPAMAAIGAQAFRAVERARALMDGGTRPRDALLSAVAGEREIMDGADAAIAALAARELDPGGAIATCSKSATALAAIAAVGPDLAIVGEGQGLGDGIAAAEWLTKRGIRVEVVPDGALAARAGDARAALVGADQVLADGSVVNRASTLALALAARYGGAPFLVACHSIKLAGRAEADLGEESGALGPAPRGVSARSPLFDVTPPDLVGGVLTESGRLTAAGAGAAGRTAAALRDEILSRAGPSRLGGRDGA